MKKILLILPLLVCACAQVSKVELPGPDTSTLVAVKDLRPPSEETREGFSFLITSAGYGIFREGDKTLSPPMTQIFRRLVYERLGRGSSVDISIYHMVVYSNVKSAFRQSAAGAALGVVGAVVAGAGARGANANLSQSLVDRSAFEAAGHEEYERAFYTDAENPEHASIYVIYIDAEVNGKRVFVRTIAPLKDQEGQSGYSLAVMSAIQYYLSQI